MPTMNDPLTATRAIRIGDPAPEFRARTTCGERTLADYRGSWLLFFAHPADFTPVCTSEFVSLVKAQDKFDAIGCKLLGLSIDSLYAHIAWLRDIREYFGVAVTFPIIEDPSMAIATAYGMLDPLAPDAAAIRASYVIDPQGIVRAVTWYPLNVGRSVEEQLRLVRALQAADSTGASTPEGWQAGMPMLELAPVSLERALQSGKDEAPWYFRERQSS
ncbi:peroxiredoxin [Paraburkholderia lycopersici]|uniref:Thioredoxin peroxidase n=1 Tax=Paraburkholderia lycopersici TaxID=416944 RepID=A0A1G6PPT6_9BURK|nr:peroxiredoxin [Paraburkholderia lycopersici]SDC81654.1 peroxiredoxin (alkyl hydroperoxide reductase subunit C) [Paraburkholderia lycopersici]